MDKCEICGSTEFEAHISQHRLGYAINGEFNYDEGCSLENEYIGEYYCSNCEKVYKNKGDER